MAAGSALQSLTQPLSPTLYLSLRLVRLSFGVALLIVVATAMGCGRSPSVQPLPTSIPQPTPDRTVDAVVRGIATFEPPPVFSATATQVLPPAETGIAPAAQVAAPLPEATPFEDATPEPAAQAPALEIPAETATPVPGVSDEPPPPTATPEPPPASEEQGPTATDTPTEGHSESPSRPSLHGRPKDS